MSSRVRAVEGFAAPWKVQNEVARWIVYPRARLLFSRNGIRWGEGWRIYGMPVVQMCRGSRLEIGSHLQLRSRVESNPLSPNHPVVLCTWRPAAVLQIGDHFAMTGGTVCATERITIGDHVTVGANTTIMDTDFHPLQSWARQREPNEAKHAAIHIGDQVFIGMQCLILKGVTLGKACVIGAGSVVTHDVAAGTVVAGNPAREVGRVAMAEA